MSIDKLPPPGENNATRYPLANALFNGDISQLTNAGNFAGMASGTPIAFVATAGIAQANLPPRFVGIKVGNNVEVYAPGNKNAPLGGVEIYADPGATAGAIVSGVSCECNPTTCVLQMSEDVDNVAKGLAFIQGLSGAPGIPDGNYPIVDLDEDAATVTIAATGNQGQHSGLTISVEAAGRQDPALLDPPQASTSTPAFESLTPPGG